MTHPDHDYDEPTWPDDGAVDELRAEVLDIPTDDDSLNTPDAGMWERAYGAAYRSTAEVRRLTTELRMAVERDDEDIQTARREERERSLDAAMRTFTNPGPDDASQRAAIVAAIRALPDDTPARTTTEEA